MRQRPAWWGSPLPALEFLTTLRLHGVPLRGADELARALWAFPLVGLLIGLGLYGLERGGRELAPEAAVAALLVAGWVLLTGGLHLDGLADTCDGLFGGRTRAQRLSIMRDTATGSWAVIGLLLVLLLKFALIVSLEPGGRLGALVAAPVVARGLIVGLMGGAGYAREEGYGKALHAAAWGMPAVATLALAALAAGLLLGPAGLAALAGVGLLGLGLAAYARARLGGLTGDVDGALIELLEVATLLAVVLALEQDWLRPVIDEGS